MLSGQNNYAIWVQENGRLNKVHDARYTPSYYKSEPPYQFCDEDFELAPWMEGVQVFWIAPGDESLTLRQNTEGCPYLNLPGRRKRLFIHNGECWAEDES